MKILEVDTEKRRLGSFGERAAAGMLRRSGYRIKKRNFVGERYELDLVCENRDYVVFVEVKTRTLESIDPREPRPASSVTKEKMRAIIEASLNYMETYPKGLWGKRKRFDIVEVYVTNKNGRKRVAEIKHLTNAFTLNDAGSYDPRKRRSQ